ncbi:MAG TPA: class II D-tagatose-bisphosphate aldolase, non-catalytic subunit [Terriglobales bacterium]|nr:class II D-tagatose-bisphosphate aldolase, non-catalytic subunit [Terriglobales bacterium]
MTLAAQHESRSTGATVRLAGVLRENRLGRGVGVYSICSANRFVLEAGMLQAQRDCSLLLIESTSNQVNQFGGYTGQTPLQFVSFVKGIAGAMNFPVERIVLGGDHLGPHVWRQEDVSSAMQKAIELVRACVLAGYTKIHLDTSMRLTGDPGDSSSPLVDEIISRRAADLCRAAEDAHRELPPSLPAPLYVIGTEVPIPGGELLDARAPETTRPEDVARTVQLARQAFEARGLQAAWERVIALVVQPGVEFGDATILHYLPEKARRLARFVDDDQWQGVYEAHSTDYQAPAALRQMVRDHFAILKVGPWLTFAFREAVFALAAVEEEWLGHRRGITISRVRESLEEAMLANPEYWKNYYRGDEAAQRFARKYSFSDRARYYWTQPDVAAALQRLLANLTAHPAPVSLLSQYLPEQSAALRARAIANDPIALIHNKVLEVINHYADACGMSAPDQQG